jgi:aspartate aminotransferase
MLRIKKGEFVINEAMFHFGDEPSAIRELFAYGLQRKAEIGADKVFDYSIGNPSVPAPNRVNVVLKRLLEQDPVAVHAYSPAAGIPHVRETIAQAISEKYDIEATPSHVYMTVGAAAAIAITLKALTHPGDEVIVVSPYFPEYRVWIETAGSTVVEVPALPDTFQLDIAALSQAITPRTSAIIINSPNNPVGTVYSEDSLQQLAKLLHEKEEEFSRPLYLISDEPYREITYGAHVPFVPALYDRTVVCYSYSKALSLPGERIGYIYVSNTASDGDDVMTAVAGAGRALGYVCAPVMLQEVAAACVNEPSDVAAYAENRRLLTEGLARIGYTYVEPEGAFYLWVKALEEDAQAFSNRARDFELLLVPSDSFGAPGWVRLSYCIAHDTILNSIPAFKALYESYQV